MFQFVLNLFLSFSQLQKLPISYDFPLGCSYYASKRFVFLILDFCLHILRHGEKNFGPKDHIFRPKIVQKYIFNCHYQKVQFSCKNTTFNQQTLKKAFKLLFKSILPSCIIEPLDNVWMV